MTSHKLIAATALVALGLAACTNNNGRGMTGAGGICKPFTTATTTTTTTTTPGAPAVLPGAAPNVLPAAGDASASLDDCLHRWGYTLAASSDPANFVAEATLAACSTALSNWNQQALTSDNGGGAVQAPSLMNGQPTNPLAEHYSFAQGRALFYVVQARAGHCGPPPATTTTTR
jgi:hypothetical protein